MADDITALKERVVEAAKRYFVPVAPPDASHELSRALAALRNAEAGDHPRLPTPRERAEPGVRYSGFEVAAKIASDRADILSWARRMAREAVVLSSPPGAISPPAKVIPIEDLAALLEGR